MKKSFLTLAVIALVLSFTSCKEVSAENTTGTEAKVTEATPIQVEVLETSDEVVNDSIDVAIEEESTTTTTTPNE